MLLINYLKKKVTRLQYKRLFCVSSIWRIFPVVSIHPDIPSDEGGSLEGRVQNLKLCGTCGKGAVTDDARSRVWYLHSKRCNICCSERTEQQWSKLWTSHDLFLVCVSIQSHALGNRSVLKVIMANICIRSGWQSLVY